MPLALRQRRRPAPLAYTGDHSPRLWLWSGLGVGVILSCGSLMQLYGMTRLSAGQVSFITTLYGSLVPVLALVLGFVPRPPVVVGLLVGFAGLYLLTGGGAASFGPAEGLVMAANFFWAAQIVVAGHFAAKVNPWLFIMAQNLAAGILLTALAALGGFLPSWEVFWRTLPFTMWGILSAGVAYLCQTLAQRDISSTTVAVFSPLQTVIAAAAGVFFLGESVTSGMVWGAAIIILGSLIAQSGRDSVRLTPGRRHYRLLNGLRLILGALILTAAVGLPVWALTSSF